MAVEWKFELVVSETMERIAVLNQARSRTLQLAHNSAGGCSFTVPMTDEMFENIEPVKHGIIAYRNDIAQWSGFILNINESLSANRMQVSCVGWFELLNRRRLRKAISYPRLSNPPLNLTGGGIVFDSAVGADPTVSTYYPGGLLTIANAQQDTWISAGINDDLMARAISYEEGQSIGEAISALTNVEAGFDFTIHPLTRVMDIKNWDDYDDRRDDAFLSFNEDGLTNIQDMGRQIDASSMNNRHTALGSFGGGLAEDLDSQANYQLMEEYSSIDTTDPNVLLAYAGSEVLLRARPRVLYSIKPFPSSEGRPPHPFVDYDVGDMIQFTAIKRPRVVVEQQAVRVFGINLTITEEGNEKLDTLQVTPT